MSETTTKKTLTKLAERFLAARRANTPLILIRTADQNATIEMLRDAMRPADETKGEYPLVLWDAARGLVAHKQAMMVLLGNKAGEQALAGGKDPITEEVYKTIEPAKTYNFTDAIVAIKPLPPKTVTFALNAHRQLLSSEPGAAAAAIQAILNLRDLYKRNLRQLVLLAPYGAVLPTEMEHDVITFDDAMADESSLAKVVSDIYEGSELAQPSAEILAKSVGALAGLSLFEAEQVTAMSLTPSGVDLDQLWERKRVSIEQTRGTTVYRGTERFADIVGLDSCKAVARLEIASGDIGVVLVLDEIDKIFANIEHDTTGVRMDQFRTFLTEMEDNEWDGMVLTGLPGAGKSLFAKALGNEAGVPTVFLDMAAMEDKFVGESGAHLREAFAKIKAIAGGRRAMVVATSNNATIMRPELQRRFTSGFYFVDMMTEAERTATVGYYMKKYAVAAQPLPEMAEWSAAEIRNCIRRSARCKVSLVESANFILPVAHARADEFSAMRAYAHGRYLDATKPGKYDGSQPVVEHVAKKLLRRVELPNDKANVN